MNTTQINSTDRPVLGRLAKVLGVLLLALMIFWSGMMVGRHEADFALHFGGHYREMFGEQVFSANGASGHVIAVNLPTIAVRNQKEIEKIILVEPNTIIRQFKNTASTSDIKIGQYIITVGSPDSSGRIKASFIRIIPSATTSPKL